MTDLISDSPDCGDSFDQIARDLQALREAAGAISYAELVRRIATLRLARGVNSTASLLPRSTVYHAFSQGRARMDTELVRDIVSALGATPEEADQWVRRCQIARKNHDAARKERVQPQERPSALPDPPLPRRMSNASMILVLIGCVALNHGGHWFLAASLDLPVYLDMIGTAVAAFMFGPWYGAAVAAVTGLTGPLFESGILAFTLVNITGALLWGYGVTRFRMGTSLTRFFALNVLTATACSLVAVPILVIVRGGAYGTIGEISSSLQSVGFSFLAATFTSNIATR